MKGLIHILAPLLLLFWVPPLCSKKISYIISQQENDHAIPLDMVKDSVDDMYSDCKPQMMQNVKHKYFDRENRGVFQKVWKKAETCAMKKTKQKDKEDAALTKDHLKAICVYTSSHPKFYELFNAAVRTNRTEYVTTFPFHSMHFWLTSAIQILNNNKKCFTVYRRSNLMFTGKVNQLIRFGFFTSTSKRTDLYHFGVKTCFEIQTCHGAYLKKYPCLGDREEEVLIPPYEMFKIAKKKSRKLTRCKVIYVLESIGFYSNLNCKAAKIDY
ncbi:ecto-ADP-ribosyltransferase 4-like [Xyrichtys novacula]|uniref:NAD(P)(+)--arginine ADP-ribosyltransferase n=1 Tax=Xyrichtys novacula TaxID=13765 RepID=A0AAV1EVJ9_XYRNO|nr:ecto-ADP-ribosyltransferase 4-like [Xyrichtys novacula]